MAKDVKMSVVIEGNSKQLQAAMAAAATSSDSAGKTITSSLKKISTSMAKASLAAVTLGAAITGVFVKKSVGTFLEFEVAMARMGATLGETSEITGELNENMDGLESVIRNIAAQSSATATQVAQAGNVLALAGLSLEELGTETEGAIKSLVQFSVVAGTDVETAAGIVISAVKGMGLEIADMDRVMDVFVATMTSSFTDLQSLGMSMKFLAPTAQAAGLSIEEMAAAVGALGDAGLQGTIAGTGLRMSINKLLSPTDDARRVMDRLGLNFLTLTPAGQSADAALRAVSATITQTKVDVERTSFALDILNGKLEDLSIEQQSNSLAIMQIRARAERQGRELTETEIKRIERLEMANKSLAVEQASVALEQRLAQRENKKFTDSLKEQEQQFSENKDIVESQTMGLTSLVDVINQLEAAGATTAEVLEIFSVRGGTAIMALQGQREGFLNLIDVTNNAEGATQRYLQTMKTTSDFQLKVVASSFEETRLVIGELFAELIGLADANDGKIANSLIKVSETLRENTDQWTALRDAIERDILPLIARLPEFVDRLMVSFELAVPFIKAFGNAMRFLGFLLKPVFFILDGIATIIEKLESTRTGRVVSSALTGAISGAAAGAFVGGGIASVPSSVIGGVGGGLIAGGAEANEQFFHRGGVATSATRGVFGEAGREALVPLDQYDMSLTKKSGMNTGSQSNSGLTLNFDSITINGGGSMTAGDVRSIISQEMPKIVKQSYRGARGVF
jgi:TP901 family phage tail tape measure protein